MEVDIPLEATESDGEDVTFEVDSTNYIPQKFEGDKLSKNGKLYSERIMASDVGRRRIDMTQNDFEIACNLVDLIDELPSVDEIRSALIPVYAALASIEIGEIRLVDDEAELNTPLTVAEEEWTAERAEKVMRRIINTHKDLKKLCRSNGIGTKSLDCRPDRPKIMDAKYQKIYNLATPEIKKEIDATGLNVMAPVHAAVKRILRAKAKHTDDLYDGTGLSPNAETELTFMPIEVEHDGTMLETPDTKSVGSITVTVRYLCEDPSIRTMHENFESVHLPIDRDAYNTYVELMQSYDDNLDDMNEYVQWVQSHELDWPRRNTHLYKHKCVQFNNTELVIIDKLDFLNEGTDKEKLVKFSNELIPINADKYKKFMRLLQVADILSGRYRFRIFMLFVEVYYRALRTILDSGKNIKYMRNVMNTFKKYRPRDIETDLKKIIEKNEVQDFYQGIAYLHCDNYDHIQNFAYDDLV